MEYIKMFTGIITEKGKIHNIISRDDHGKIMEILTSRPAISIPLGASIACDGVCLTVTKTANIKIDDQPMTVFWVTLSSETLSCTTASSWKKNQVLNLEHALKMGDELGGHFVFGHVDAKIDFLTSTVYEESVLMRFSLPDALKGLVASKGSLAINGVSLTVNKIKDQKEDQEQGFFEVMIIPHSWKNTNLSLLRLGDKVNLEADMLARYVHRQYLLQHGLE